MTNPIVSNHSTGQTPAPIRASAIQGVLDAGALAGAGPEPGSNQLTRIVAALRRFAWLIVLVTVVGSVLSVLATRFLQPKYEVTSILYLQNTSPNPNGPIQAPQILSEQNWVELNKTFAVLDPVVRELKLYLIPGKGTPPDFFDGFDLAPRFTPGSYQLIVNETGTRYSLRLKGGPAELASGAVTDSVGRAAGFLWQPGSQKLTRGLEVDFTVQSPRDAAVALRSNLGVRLSNDRGSFLILTLEGSDPKQIAATLNSVQTHFVEAAADLKKAKLIELSKVLEEQVGKQEAKLRAAEGALEAFKVATVTQPREAAPVPAGLLMTSSSAYDRYFTQRVDVETIQNDRRAIEDVLSRLRAGENVVDAFYTINAVRNSKDLGQALSELSSGQAELRAAQMKYTDEYPAVKALQDKITTIRQQTIPVYAQALVNQLKIQEREIESRIASAGQELKAIPIRAITEARLTRDVESARFLATNLQNRYEENKLAELSATPDIRVWDPAVAPSRPSKNRAPQIILMGIAMSLAAGLGLAILLDRLDKRFRYPEQASSELGLTILGAIPAIPRPRNGKKVSSDEMHQVIESFRSVRLNLAHSYEPEQPICLTISSPSPGDGKSLVAANLALSFAEAGYRTILVDGDVRRGDLHRTFSADRRPGLLDYLGSSRLPLDRAFRPTSHPRLTLMPCGTRLQHGPELLGSARMAELVDQLRKDFEVIVVDSPPLGAGIDPFVLGTHTGNIMIVLRSGETDREMAEVKLRVLERLPVRILGAVLNHIAAGHGPYKYYTYSYGYAAEEELSDEAERKTLPSAGAPTTAG